MNIKLNFFVIVLWSMASCTKQTAYESDKIKPEIKVIYPLDNPAIYPGDALCMKVLISDNKSLLSVYLQVNDGHGSSKEYNIEGRSIDIIEKYIIPSNIQGNLTATYTATDEAGNTSSKQIKFSVSH